MAEIIFLWFGIVAILSGVDMLQRNKDAGVVVIMLGGAAIIYYIVSVVTLP